MGYLRLRYLLQHRYISMRDVAQLLNTSVNRIYDLTGIRIVDANIDFTQEEKQKIYDKWFTGDPRSLEEVFVKDGEDKSAFARR